MSLVFTGCTDDTEHSEQNRTQDDSSNGLATQAQVSQCQQACDTQRFYQCYDATQHGQCYDDCASADPDSVSKFTGCVNATTCDAECSVHIEGRSSQVAPEDRVDTQKPITCQEACAAMVADRCVPENCEAQCSDSEIAFIIVHCNNVRNGCDFPQECNPGETN